MPKPVCESPGRSPLAACQVTPHTHLAESQGVFVAAHPAGVDTRIASRDIAVSNTMATRVALHPSDVDLFTSVNTKSS